MNPKWWYFITGAVISILACTYLFSDNGWYIPGLLIAAPVITMLIYPEKRLLSRFFLWGVLASFSTMFIFGILF